MNRIKQCMLGFVLGLSTHTYADPVSSLYYFYFWAESYKIDVDPQGRAFLMTHIKTSDPSRFNFTVNGNQVATNMMVISDEVVDFPITLGGKYTKEDRAIICSSKSNSNISFKQEICLNIRLTKP